MDLCCLYYLTIRNARLLRTLLSATMYTLLYRTENTIYEKISQQCIYGASQAKMGLQERCLQIIHQSALQQHTPRNKALRTWGILEVLKPSSSFLQNTPHQLQELPNKSRWRPYPSSTRSNRPPSSPPQSSQSASAPATSSPSSSPPSRHPTAP